MPLEQYHHALLRLQLRASDFAQAFAEAATAAQAVDPAGALRDPLAEQVMSGCAAILRTATAHIPGAREVFVLALFGKD